MSQITSLTGVDVNKALLVLHVLFAKFLRLPRQLNKNKNITGIVNKWKRKQNFTDEVFQRWKTRVVFILHLSSCQCIILFGRVINQSSPLALVLSAASLPAPCVLRSLFSQSAQKSNKTFQNLLTQFDRHKYWIRCVCVCVCVSQ